MLVSFSETFLDELNALPLGLQKKCKLMLGELRRADAKRLGADALPGWRLHKLKNSPFISLSIDMNYRLLAKQEGETLTVYRVVKHDLADAPRVNRNDAETSTFTLSAEQLRVGEIVGALRALGIGTSASMPFDRVQTEDELMVALGQAHPNVAALALSLYEMTGVQVPRAKYHLLQEDAGFEEALLGSSGGWSEYLHPSQEYLVSLPGETRIAVAGSAGTGKTVCAWHRFRRLLANGQSVGFVAPNENTLNISRSRLESYANDQAKAVFLLPKTANELGQLTRAVDHVIVDEGQELSPAWLDAIGDALRHTSGGLTLFYDLNQLGGNIQRGDQGRFKKRFDQWETSLRRLPSCGRFKLFVNYRNSREIARHYADVLRDVLPSVLEADIPTFSTGDVIEHQCGTVEDLSAAVAQTLLRLREEYALEEIAVVCLGGTMSPKHLGEKLTAFGFAIADRPSDTGGLAVTEPGQIRGYERRAVIVCRRKGDARYRDDWGRAIDAYVAYSRARDRLIILDA